VAGDTTFTRYMQQLAAEGKDPHEQLREVRATFPRQLSYSDAWAVAYQATADYRNNPDDSLKRAIYRNMLDAYVMWKMANDDEYWNELQRLMD
jgi:hypothetical protein